MVEYAYIIDFLSVALICLDVCNTGEAAEKPLRNRVERVASYLFHNLTFTFGCTEAEEVLHGGKGRGPPRFFARTRSRTAASSGTGSPFWRASFFIAM
jgi:hypothetical protein